MSKKPPEVGGFLLQLGEKAFELYHFHNWIVNGFRTTVKVRSCGMLKPPVGWRRAVSSELLEIIERKSENA